MITFKKLSIRNFMSVGEIIQTIDFDSNSIHLILGENLDMLSENQNIARNGSGKSTIMHSLSFALYGLPLTNINGCLF